MTAKIRYKDEGAPALVWQHAPDALTVAFSTPRRAITPGQAVVLYEGEDVVAGGWIHEVGKPMETASEGAEQPSIMPAP